MKSKIQFAAWFPELYLIWLDILQEKIINQCMFVMDYYHRFISNREELFLCELRDELSLTSSIQPL